MTGTMPAVDRFEPELGPTGAAAPPEPALDEAPRWPVTRLAAWSLTLLLGLSIFVPATVGGARGTEWLALLLPAILLTLSARALFEVLGLAARPRRVLGHVVAAVVPALFAATLMAGASVIVGVGWSPVVGGTTVVLTMVTLVSAGAVRDVEIRVRLSLRRLYFIGSHESQADLQRELSRRRDARFVGALTVDTRADRTALVETVLSSKATVLVLDSCASRVAELIDAASHLNLTGVHVRDLVSYYESEFKKVPLSELSPTWFLFDIASIHRRRAYRALRRAFDAVLAAAMLLLASPLLLLAAVVIRFTTPGPALYRQRRVGKGGA
jgi:hypothetical protein